jgi:hypothetical protein
VAEKRENKPEGWRGPVTGRRRFLSRGRIIKEEIF